MGCIYEFKNKINNKIYVGQTIDLKQRLRSHKYNLINHKKTNPFYSALGKYGWENFEISILEECEDYLLNEREISWINQKSSLYPLGYNLLIGGNQSKHSEYTKKKLSENRKGIKFSESHIENLRKSHLGYKMPDEQRNKISLSNLGKTIPTEIKEKIRYGQQNRREVIRYNKFGEIVCKYPSIREAGNQLGCSAGHVSECCRGKRKLSKILDGDSLKFFESGA